MQHIIATVVLGGLLLSSACGVARDSAAVSDAAPDAAPETQQTDNTSPATPGAPPQSAESLPIFVEVTQRTTMSGPPAQKAPLQVGVPGFQFKPDANVLWVEPSKLEVSLEAEALIGLTTVLWTSAQSYENRELVQFPAEQTAVIRIWELDADTGTVHLTHASESYALPPGERLEFKRAGGSAGTPTTITTIANHGRLSAIQPAASDGSVR